MEVDPVSQSFFNQFSERDAVLLGSNPSFDQQLHVDENSVTLVPFRGCVIR